MSWYKLTPQQQDVLVRDGLNEFIFSPTPTPAAEDCWRDFVLDNVSRLRDAIIHHDTTVGAEILSDLALKATRYDAFDSAYRDHLRETLDD